MTAMFVLSLIMAQTPLWQYTIPFDTGRADRPGTVYCWIPPQTKTVRGLFLIGQLGIEGELANDAEFRKACADSDVAIVYFTPHIDGTFNYWKADNTSPQRLLKALDDLAARTGHPEMNRVPWITAGHSTAGIYCRNVAYWKPERVAGILHIKSGNFWEASNKPPTGSLAGVPLLAINGQLETFGPAEGIDPVYGHETQWVYVEKNLQRFRAADPEHLMGIWVDPGADHFMGRRMLYNEAALFIRKTAQYRLPTTIPAGTAPIPARPMKAEEGWLIDPDLKQPLNPAAAYKDYQGDKAKAMWYYDEEMANGTLHDNHNFGEDQGLDGVKFLWATDGDGYTVTVSTSPSESLKAWYGGTVGGKKVTAANAPITFETTAGSPLQQIGPNQFRLLRQPTGKGARVTIIASSPGDKDHRATMTWDWPLWTDIWPPKGEDGKPLPFAKQTIAFPAVPDLKAGDAPYTLQAMASSGLPVYYEIDYGPLAIKDGKLVVDGLPTNPQFPFDCKVTAYQIGRRVGGPIAPADPVSVTFKVVK